MAGSLLSPAAMSPLGAALGGNSGMMGAYNLAMYDPRSLGALQQMQLGQSLIGEGLNSQPAYPAQAASRLGQALIGALMLKRGYGTLGDLSAGQNGQTAAELNALAKINEGLMQPPPATTVQPQAPTPQAQAAQTFAGGGQPTASNATLQPIIAEAAKRNGIPLQLANAYLQQESGLGTDPRAGTNVGQVTFATANNPGFGMTPLSGEDWKDPAKNIDFSLQYLRHRGDAAGIKDWNDPSQWGLALRGYNGTGDPNYVQHVARYLPQGTQVADPGIPGRVQLAQAGNVATDAIPAPGAGAAPQVTAQASPQAMSAGAMPGAGAAPQVGMANPQVAATVQGIQQLNNIIAGHPFPLDPVRLHAQAALENLKQRLQIGNVQVGPGGVQTNTLSGQQSAAAAPLAHYIEDPSHPGVYIDTTGTHPPTFQPAQRFATNAAGDLLQGKQGGGAAVVSPNPSGITGSTPESNAMRIISDYTAKKNGGIVTTPQEDAAYATAYETFLKRQIHTGPNLELLSAPTNTPPVGAPVPQAPQQQSSAAPAAAPGSVQVLTPSARGPAAAQSITEHQGNADVENLSKEAATIVPYHSILGTTATIRSVLPQVTTGVGAEQRLAASRVLGMLGFDENAQKEMTGTSAPAGELLQKKLFELSTGAVRTMGAREPGSVLQMFQKNYPKMTSRDMTIDAMTRLLDLDQIYKEDELAARSGHIQTSIQGLSQNKPYTGLTDYKPPDPRLYEAAAMASGGMPFNIWSSGLAPDQQTQALRLAARVYPDASALDSKGVRHVFRGGQQ